MSQRSDTPSTPRTDAETYLEPTDISLIGVPVVPASFAQKLERQLMALGEELARRNEAPPQAKMIAAIEQRVIKAANELAGLRKYLTEWSPSEIAPSGWIPVKERQPEGYGEVLVAHPVFSNTATEWCGVTIRSASTVRLWMSDKGDTSMVDAFWMWLPKGPL